MWEMMSKSAVKLKVKVLKQILKVSSLLGHLESESRTKNKSPDESRSTK
jgi:hypothetical protein